MDAKMIFGIVVAAAIVVLVAIMGYVAYSRRRLPGYSDAELTDAIRLAYSEKGSDANELDIQKIVEVEKEGEDGKSVYDVRIKFLAGKEVGKVVDFRYSFHKPKASNPVVDDVHAAPASSPLKK